MTSVKQQVRDIAYELFDRRDPMDYQTVVGVYKKAGHWTVQVQTAFNSREIVIGANLNEVKAFVEARNNMEPPSNPYAGGNGFSD